MDFNVEDLAIRVINYHSEEYRKELELRDEVLRKPLGMSLFDENLEKEKMDIHIGAFVKNKLVGVLILTPLNLSDIKMRQVAVLETTRSQKVGSQLVQFAEEYAKDKGYALMR